MTKKPKKTTKKPNSIIYRRDTGQEKSVGDRMGQAFRDIEALQQIDNLNTLIPEWIQSIDTVRQYAIEINKILSTPQAEMIVALAKLSEQDEILFGVLDNLANGIMLWQNAPLLQSVDARSLQTILEIMEPETIEQAIKNSDEKTKQKIKSGIMRAIESLKEGDE